MLKLIVMVIGREMLCSDQQNHRQGSDAPPGETGQSNIGFGIYFKDAVRLRCTP